MLQGGINFRDFGGHTTQEGRRIQKQRLYRSGALSQITAEDLVLLKNLGITHIIDYRDPNEVQHNKNILWEGVTYEPCPANPVSHAITDIRRDFFCNENLEALTDDFMETLYQRLPFANKAYQTFFQRVQNLDTGAILHHCAVGKDRTGVGSALLLLALGASEQAVFEDYLTTDKFLSPFKQQLLDRMEEKLSHKALMRFEYVMRANEIFLHTALAAIRERFGDLDNYFAQEFNLHLENRKLFQLKWTE